MYTQKCGEFEQRCTENIKETGDVATGGKEEEVVVMNGLIPRTWLHARRPTTEDGFYAPKLV